ncbi:hypothetical protein [Brevundimonas sp. SPF441]|uniref:hypothetical protein n=1 Tax=Brevundimonas sp. SPF441 TaxID=2663795 RepID=UPI001892B409|nr:hypothetical protein [Brevundimonas sp. SPF441]
MFTTSTSRAGVSPKPAGSRASSSSEPERRKMADAIVQVFEGRATISFSGPEVISSLLTQASAAAQSAAEDAGRAVEAKDEIVAISDLIQESIIPPNLDVGTVQSGSSNLIRMDRIVTNGANDGTSQVYQLVNRVYARGAVNYDSVRAHYSGTHIDTTAGTTTNADGLHQYVWLGGAGNVAYSKVIAAHLRADGPGDVGEAILFRAVSTTLGADASVGQIKGFSSGQLGDPTKVDSVIAFDAEDTSAVSYAIGFRSTFMAGDNKYAFFGAGTAPSAFGGKVGIGQTIPPLWQLTVKGSDNNWTADIQNDHSSSPSGVRVRYTGSAPSSSENYFYSGYDTSGLKFGIASNGRYQIGANFVLNSRQAAVTAPTGGSTVDAQARTAINDLIQRLQAHGLIS